MEKVFLLIWDHKHGQDYLVFSSERLAKEHGTEIMRNNLYEWGECEEFQNLSEEDLWSSWAEISGDTEYFYIEGLEVDPTIV